MTLYKAAVQWIVSSVSDAIQFYSEKLGFSIDWVGDGPLFAILSRDNFSVMLRELKQQNLARPNRKPFLSSGWHTDGAQAWDAYIWVKDIHKLHKEFKEKNVVFVKDLNTTPYGNTEFEIEDLDGYILCFGETTS